jgi:uncharacterized membrane protein YphA (DoxX/SURF4 family)
MPRKLFRRLMQTSLPGPVIVLRWFVAAVLAVDSWRCWKDSVFLGHSAIENLAIVSPELEKGVIALQLTCALMIGTGWMTRLASALVIVQWTTEVTRAWSRVGSLGTARALDETLVAAGVVSICLFLVLRGAGTWSIDARLTRTSGRR